MAKNKNKPRYQEPPPALDVDDMLEEDTQVQKTRNEQATCSTCPFCHQRRECRRESPVLPSKTGTYSGIQHPPTQHDSWCGQHPDFFA